MTRTDGTLAALVRNDNKAEKIADGLIHVIGLALAVCGASALMILSSRSSSFPTIASAGVYAASLVATLVFSAAYNMWPASPLKCLLRRLDQAAIFLLIGGTYTAFLTRLPDYSVSLLALGVIWAIVIAGTLIKLTLPGRFERLSVAAYLALGWSGLVFFPTAIRSLAADGAGPDRVRRSTLLSRCHFPFVGAPTFSERNLARLRARRRRLPLRSGAGLFGRCANINDMANIHVCNHRWRGLTRQEPVQNRR